MSVPVFNCQKEIPPDIDLQQASLPESERANRLIASLQSEKDENLQKIREQKIKKSLINYQLVLNILTTELQAEKDQNIQAAILAQLNILKAILDYKQFNKKKELDAVLQKQAQAQNQTKTYAQAVKENLSTEKEQKVNQDLLKAQQKQDRTQKYREKRLVIQVAKKEAEMLNS